VVEADLQRDRERRRGADRPAARPHFARERAGRPRPPRPRPVDEGKAVAARGGIELHEDPWEMNVLATQRGSAHYPSMLEDVEAHRPTEIELITGALVREGERARCAGALHTALYRPREGEGASWSVTTGRRGPIKEGSQ
jgi:hypothetical protein